MAATLTRKETDAAAEAALAAHEALTQGVHGIDDAADLVTAEQLQDALDGLGGGGGLPKAEDWHVIGGAGEPAFGPGWQNFAEAEFDPVPARFRKDELGDVVIEGFVVGDGTGRTVLQLPAGYRPVGLSCFPQAGNTEAFRLDFLPDGTVRAVRPNIAFMSLMARFRPA